MKLPVVAMPLAADRSHRTGAAYDSVFLACYAANTLLMTAISLLFRYADFVRWCGGSEQDLGWIVGMGMAGAIWVRYFQGGAMDRWGTRLVWLVSLAAIVASVLGHTLVRRVDTVTVYLLRLVYMMGVAGAFGASTTFVSLRAPPGRMAEMIGILGSSGFVGMAIGPVLGDWLFSFGKLSDQIQRMFFTSALLVLVSAVCVVLATRGAPRPALRRLPPVWAIIWRYHPGSILLAAAAMGMGLQMPHIFVRAYGAEIGLAGIRTFFLMYAATAFVARWATRHWTDRRGPRWGIIGGLAALAASMVLQLAVRSDWQWALPAAAAGLGHALLFPAVVSGGTRSFPPRYRGVAVMLTLAMFDLGALIGQPLVGTLVNWGRRMQWPAYEVAFSVVASLLAASAFVFWLTARHESHDANVHPAG
ncbi:MAG: hypothetical protein KatS3mg110_4165 [Pirellulaceae bacterium]|nr:MAG: hypothetical protein KatS3mg110_4165 [Pirellulaceae bacterium]